MNLSIANGATIMEPQVKLRTLRHKATGVVTTQSTNKTKRMLKSGNYVEVVPEGSNVEPLRTQPETNERANAQKAGRPYLWIATACFSLAAVMITILIVIK